MLKIYRKQDIIIFLMCPAWPGVVDSANYS